MQDTRGDRSKWNRINWQNNWKSELAKSEQWSVTIVWRYVLRYGSALSAHGYSLHGFCVLLQIGKSHRRNNHLRLTLISKTHLHIRYSVEKHARNVVSASFPSISPSFYKRLSISADTSLSFIDNFVFSFLFRKNFNTPSLFINKS